MSSKKTYEFVLNTTMSCFFCYEELEAVEKLTSLKSICRHLKVDLSKTIALRKQLLPILSKLDVQVNLCEGCRTESEKFSKLYREMEGIKMKLGISLETLLKKITVAGKRPELLKEHLQKLQRDPNPKAKLHARMVGRLRKEVMLKCHSFSKRSLPRVKIHKMCERAQPKLKATSNSPQITQVRSLGSASGPDNLHCEKAKVTMTQEIVNLDSDTEEPTVLPQEGRLSSERKFDENTSSSSVPPIKCSVPVTLPGTRTTHQCNLCRKAFSNLRDIRIHIHLDHNYRWRFCNLCNKSFYEKLPATHGIFLGEDTSGTNSNSGSGAPTTSNNLQGSAKPGSMCRSCSKLFGTHKSKTITDDKGTLSRPNPDPAIAPNIINIRHAPHHRLLLPRPEDKESIRPFICKLCWSPFETREGLRNHIMMKHRGDARSRNMVLETWVTSSDCSALQQNEQQQQRVDVSENFLCHQCHTIFSSEAWLSYHQQFNCEQRKAELVTQVSAGAGSSGVVTQAGSQQRQDTRIPRIARLSAKNSYMAGYDVKANDNSQTRFINREVLDMDSEPILEKVNYDGDNDVKPNNDKLEESIPDPLA